MRFITKHVVLSLLLWFALYLPGSAESANYVWIPIVGIKDGTDILVSPEQQWRSCSNYFFSVETSRGGKKVYFRVATVVNGVLKERPVYAPMNQVELAIGEEAEYPSFTMMEKGGTALYKIRLSAVDYIERLRCLPSLSRDINS